MQDFASLTAMTPQGAGIQGALKSLESIKGGNAGPSNATGGYHDSSFILEGGVNIGSGNGVLNPWMVGAIAIAALGAYVYVNR
jgi:hypothetical protein